MADFPEQFAEVSAAKRIGDQTSSDEEESMAVDDSANIGEPEEIDEFQSSYMKDESPIPPSTPSQSQTRSNSKKKPEPPKKTSRTTRRRRAVSSSDDD